MKLSGKVAIITGGGTGIGKATALTLAREGAKVLVIGRREKPLLDTVDEIHIANGEAAYHVSDISISEQVGAMYAKAERQFGKIDILFNNAGVFTGGKEVVDISEDEWDNYMSINLKGTFLCSKYVIPYMIKNGGGSIICCTSISGHIGQKMQAAYNVTKAGIEMLSKCIALEMGPHNIRVNTVSPGLIQTDLVSKDIQKRREYLEKMHPLGRLGKPEDIASAVLYLVSDDARWVTGISLIVDGGFR